MSLLINEAKTKYMTSGEIYSTKPEVHIGRNKFKTVD